MTRFKPLLALLLALLALVATVSACSSSTAGNAADAGSGGASSGGASSAFPVTVATQFGDVTVTSQPHRVVALGWGDAETALALGVQPVGASDWLNFGGEGVGPWAHGLYTTAPKIIGTLNPSYESILALKPDLILDVKSSGDAARYKRLSEIAPTIGIPRGAANYVTTFAQQMTMISEALGQKAKGAQIVSQVDGAFSQAAATHPAWKGKTVSVATRTSDGWGAYTAQDARTEFMTRLGFVQNPKIAALKPASTGFSVDISSENLDDLDADLVVAFPIFIKTTEITGNASWKAVPAVAAGHAVVVDGDLANAFSLGTSLATLYAIKQLVPKVSAAIGG